MLYAFSRVSGSLIIHLLQWLRLRQAFLSGDATHDRPRAVLPCGCAVFLGELEAQTIAHRLGESQWEARAKGELAILAFLEGDSRRAATLVAGPTFVEAPKTIRWALDGKRHRLVARLIVVGELLKTTHASPDWLKRVFGHNACGHLDVELSQIVARRRHKHALDALSKVSPKVPDVAGNEMRGPRRHRSQKDGHILVGQSQVLGKTT